MNKQVKLILFTVLMMLMLVAPVAAQIPTPSTSTPQLAVLSGKIVNRSKGGTVPTKFDLVLHAWDQNLNERLMRDGQSDPDGTFQFKDVPVETGMSYGVMAVYNSITYLSTPVAATGQPLTGIEIPIYETTTDSANVQIDQMYSMFFYTPAGLQVAEVYIVSNRSDRTVKDAVKLTDGQLATLQFPLPADAINLAFDPANKDQFLRTPDGFAHTGPLVPGAQPSRLAIRYVLPYQSGITYTINAPYPMRGVNILAESNSGLTVTGEGLTNGGIEKISDTRQLTVMKHGPLPAGEKAVITLTGQPKVSDIGQPVSETPAPDPMHTPEAWLGFAGIILALGLVVFGAWWFRRPEPALVLTEVSDGSALTDSPAQITVSDEAHGRGGQEPDNVHRDDSFQQAQDTTQDSKHFTDRA